MARRRRCIGQRKRTRQPSTSPTKSGARTLTAVLGVLLSVRAHAVAHVGRRHWASALARSATHTRRARDSATTAVEGIGGDVGARQTARGAAGSAGEAALVSNAGQIGRAHV